MARLTAGARKRADGTLEKRFTIGGKRYSVYGKTAQELTKKETELRQRIAAGSYTQNATITLDRYFTEWSERRKGVVKESTRAGNERIYRNMIAPHLGRRKVAKIERRQIIDLQATLKGTYKSTTANAAITLLHTILKDAERDGIIIKNPASDIRSLKFADTERRAADTIHRALTIEEQAAFMEAAKGSYLYEMIAFLLCTGVRIGEAGALTWGDIDHKTNVIHITKTITRGGSVGTPKTKTSIRDIPITDTIRQILKAQREKLGRVIVPAPACKVFLSTYGKPVSDSNINLQIDKITEAAGIEHISVHALRATFATRFIEQGGNPQTLKTILGHSSLAMTMDLYAHVLPNTKQEEMDRLRIIV